MDNRQSQENWQAHGSRYWTPLAVFVTALCIRLGYSLAFPHDSAANLVDNKTVQAGQELAQLLWTAHGPSDFIAALLRAHPPPMASELLTGTLMSLGPLYLSYIALVTFLFKGTLLGATTVEHYYVPLSICDSVMGALTACLIYYTGRLAFERRTGLAAALIYSFYPATIIAVGIGRSELLFCFLLALFACMSLMAILRHLKLAVRAGIYFAFGLVSGLVMLTNPVLALLPPLVVASIIVLEVLPRMMDESKERAPKEAAKQPTPVVPAPAPESSSVEAQTDSSKTDSQSVEEATTDSAPASAAQRLSTANEIGVIKEEQKEETPTAEGESKGEEEKKEETAAVEGESTAEEEKKESAGELNFDPAAEEAAAKADESPGDDKPSTPAEESKPVEQATEAAPAESAPQIADGAASVKQETAQRDSTGEKRANHFIVLVLSFLLGSGLLLGAWYHFGSMASGITSLTQEQLLSTDILYGNQLSSDGWKLMPPTGYYAENLSTIVHRLLGSLVVNPVHYTELLLRKIPRLWSGSSNDFQQSCFGLGTDAQNVLHEMLLYLGWIGLAIVLLRYRKWRRSRSVKAGIILALIAVFHFAYIVLSPISSLALTAMPAVSLLAGFAVLRLLDIRTSKRVEAWFPLLFAAFLFWMMQARCSLVPQFVSIFPDMPFFLGLSRVFDCAIWLLALAFLLSLTLNIITAITGRTNTIAGDLIKFGFGCLGFLTLTWSAFDMGWQEWFAELKNSREQIEVQMYVPALNEIAELGSGAEQQLPRTTFVLIDCESPVMAPPLSVAVNGVQSRLPALPWLQLRPGDPLVTGLLAKQGQCMGKDLRSLRQWWACAVPTTAIKFGELNTITISIVQGDALATYRFYGTYGQNIATASKNESYKIMPSLYYMSMDKGFNTFDNRDPRVLESVLLSGTIASNSIAIGDTRQYSDLSFAHGKQTGSYRVRLAVPNAIAYGLQPAANEAVTRIMIADVPLYLKDEGVVAQGSDPATMLLTPEPLKIPGDLPSQAVLSFSCELSAPTGQGEASVSIVLTGTQDGKQVTWISPWQPVVTPVTGDWRAYTFADLIPDNILRLQDLTAQIFVTPGQPVIAVTHPEWARQQSVNVRMVRLQILPPIEIPPEGQRDWIIF